MTLSTEATRLFIGTGVSVIALFIAYLAYRRKSGLRLRGKYITTSTVQCADVYVSGVTIENFKDRSVTIFAIYLQIGPNIFVLIEDFVEQPLLLRPFETYQKSYDPIEFYVVNFNRIRIDPLLEDDSVRKRLVLSTSEGRYIVRKYLRAWDPVHLFFRNHLTGIVRPIRSMYKGRAYGSKAAYLVEVTLPNGKEQVIPFYQDDWRLNKFRDFSLTRDALESKEALESRLQWAKQAGHFEVSSIHVLDLKALREERFEKFAGEPFVPKKIGWVVYYVVGRARTRISNWRMRRRNRKVAQDDVKSASNTRAK